jgi:hypothetical protein
MSRERRVTGPRAMIAPGTVLVVVSHVEETLHCRLKQGVAAARREVRGVRWDKCLRREPAASHHVGLPNLLHAGVNRHLEVYDNGVHDDREGGVVDAVAAQSSEVQANPWLN